MKILRFDCGCVGLCDDTSIKNQRDWQVGDLIILKKCADDTGMPRLQVLVAREADLLDYRTKGFSQPVQLSTSTVYFTQIRSLMQAGEKFRELKTLLAD